jgi:hypothetical protein
MSWPRERHFALRQHLKKAKFLQSQDQRPPQPGQRAENSAGQPDAHPV